jgi:hypothetical protein
MTREDVEKLIAETPVVKFGEEEIKAINLHGAELSGLDLSGLDLSRSTFHGAICRGTKFVQCNLKGSNFHGADLNGAIFSGAQLDGVNFHGACLCNALLYSARHPRANFSDACMEATDGIDIVTKLCSISELNDKPPTSPFSYADGKLTVFNVDHGANISDLSLKHLTPEDRASRAATHAARSREVAVQAEKTADTLSTHRVGLAEKARKNNVKVHRDLLVKLEASKPKTAAEIADREMRIEITKNRLSLLGE